MWPAAAATPLYTFMAGSQLLPCFPTPSTRPQSQDKTLRLINSFWHILVREPGNDKINAAIADWVLERAK